MKFYYLFAASVLISMFVMFSCENREKTTRYETCMKFAKDNSTCKEIR